MEQIEETKGIQEDQSNKLLFAKLDSFLRGYNRQSIKITTLQKKIPLDIDTLNNWLRRIDKQSQLTGSGKNLILNNFYKTAKTSSTNTNTNTSNKISVNRQSLSKNKAQDIQLQLSNLTTQLDIVLQQELLPSSDKIGESTSSHHSAVFDDLQRRSTTFATLNNLNSRRPVMQGVDSDFGTSPQQDLRIIQKDDQSEHSIAYLVNELCETVDQSQSIKNDQKDINSLNELSQSKSVILDHQVSPQQFQTQSADLRILQQSTDKQQQLILQSMYKEFLFDNDNNSDWKTMFKQDVEFCIMKSSQGLYYNQIQYFLNDPELNQYKFTNIIFQIIYICLQLLIQQKTEKEHRDNVFHMNLRKMMTGITTDQRSNDVINSVLEILKNTSNASLTR